MLEDPLKFALVSVERFDGWSFELEGRLTFAGTACSGGVRLFGTDLIASPPIFPLAPCRSKLVGMGLGLGLGFLLSVGAVDFL